ncbi:MAG: hypothetical protein LH645_12970 [Actinomycetia bacterium]|nr:hypothetical protein [Actinomycetes bacterium]
MRATRGCRGIVIRCRTVSETEPSPANRWVLHVFEAVISMGGAHRRSLGPAVAMALAVMTASACSGAPTPETAPSPDDSTSPAATSSPAGSASPNPTQKATDTVLANYDKFWAAQVNSQAAPQERPDPGLARHSVDKALADAQATIFLFRKNGIEMRGHPTHDVEVTSLTLSDPPTASITDCVDSTKWRPVYAATGKSARAPGQSRRVIVESTATIYDGRWVINTSIAHRDRSC